jgi:hypothetical protein
MPEIIGDPAAVTADWLSEVLEQGGYQAEVSDFTRTKVGTGQVGLNIRFTLSYASGNGPETIVGKFASDDPTSRQTGISQNTYLKEVRFYQELRPTVQISTPTVLFTDIDEATHNFCLMMEDLAPAVQGDQIAGCSPDQALLAVKELIGLHAPHWNNHGLNELAWLNPGVDPAEAAEFGTLLYNQLFTGFVERYGDRLTPEYIDLGRQLGEGHTHYSLAYDGPLTIAHGDYRLDNMLFGGVHGLAVVDWQTPAIRAGASDLAYFIGAGLLPDDRREHEKKLVETYHQGLTDYGVANYSLADCWNDYRRFSFSGYIMAVIASMIVGRTDRGDDMFMAMATRHAQQALDLDATDFLRA